MENPYEIDRHRDEHPLYCHGCGGYLGDYETAQPGEIAEWNGWYWCKEHAEEMKRLAQSPDPVNEVRR